MSCRLVFGLILAIRVAAPAHEFFSTKITWSREISRIVYKRCAGCHRPGGAAFSLLTFEEARPWATAMKEEILSRRMPPWGAAKGFGSFANDRGLSQDEISLLADWVEGGAPEGQRIYLPKAPPPVVTEKLSRYPETVMPSTVLQSQITIAGIALKGSIPVGAQLTAQLPDGSEEPLIWVIDPKAAVSRDFLFNEPRTFPPGSKFALSKPGGTWKLLLPARPSAGVRKP